MNTMKKVSLLIIFLALSQMALTQDKSQKCGTWRWDVKTLTDNAGLALLTAVPGPSTIDALVVEKPPKVLKESSIADGKLPRYPSENKVVEITAYVTEVKNETDDRDLHFVLKSPTSSSTMVGEIPDPTCPNFAAFVPIKTHFEKTRADGTTIWNKLKSSKKPVKVKITGVPFWDGVHATAPSGASPYFREIHPILSIEIVN